jgi:adenylate cyclase
MPEVTPPVTSSIQELRQAQSLVEQVTQSLQSQKDILKARGMNLPPLVLTELASVRIDLQKLESTLVEEQTELGQLRALVNMSAGITTSLDAEVVLEDAMDIVIALTRAERGYIILLNDDGSFSFRVSRDNTLKPGMTVSGREPEISKTILRQVIQSGEAMLSDNAFQDSRFENQASVANMVLRSVLCVPLNYKARCIGAVYVDNRMQASIFTEREKQTLMAFANTAAVAIANARYYAEIQRSLEEITEVQELMNNVFDSIGSGLVATNAQDVITTFNPAAEDILLLEAKDTVGQAITKVLPRVINDLDEHLEAIRDALESQTIEASMARADGERTSLMLKLSPLRDSEAQVQGVAIVIDDVTQKREREQQLRVMKTYLPPEMIDQIHEISQMGLGGARRYVTCMFAEVRPISSLHEFSPKEVMDIVNEYLQIGASCVRKTHGVIDKYMGTEIMALWNTQLNPLENQAELAMECALLMKENFHALYQRLGINPSPPWYRVGVHTGFAVLGNVGSPSRRDFTAIGDTINLAKRLEENTPYGQLIFSEDTLKLFQQTSPNAPYRFEERPAILGKGKSTATQVYEVFRSDAN